MSRLTISLLVTLAFALLGWAMAGVTVDGAIAGFAVAFLLYVGIGPAGFAVLLAVFVITWVTTRLGRARKQRLGIAERRRGRRTAAQVLANTGVSGAFAALVLVANTSPILRSVGIAASMAALAEAAADTCSSECGEACSDTSFLVPRLRPVPAGTDGAITLWGTLSGIFAAAVIATIALILGVFPVYTAVIVATSGVFGMCVDTFLGATLERRGLLRNNAVNFCSTVAAALFALALVALI